MITYEDFDLSKCTLPISTKEAEVIVDCIEMAAGEGFYGLAVKRRQDRGTNGESKKNRDALNNICKMLGLKDEFLGDNIVENLMGYSDEKSKCTLLKRGVRVLGISGIKGDD